MGIHRADLTTPFPDKDFSLVTCRPALQNSSIFHIHLYESGFRTYQATRYQIGALRHSALKDALDAWLHPGAIARFIITKPNPLQPNYNQKQWQLLLADIAAESLPTAVPHTQHTVYKGEDLTAMESTHYLVTADAFIQLNPAQSGKDYRSNSSDLVTCSHHFLPQTRAHTQAQIAKGAILLEKEFAHQWLSPYKNKPGFQVSSAKSVATMLFSARFNHGLLGRPALVLNHNPSIPFDPFGL
jgi:hypothetical protein